MSLLIYGKMIHLFDEYIRFTSIFLPRISFCILQLGKTANCIRETYKREVWRHPLYYRGVVVPLSKKRVAPPIHADLVRGEGQRKYLQGLFINVGRRCFNATRLTRLVGVWFHDIQINSKIEKSESEEEESCLHCGWTATIRFSFVSVSEHPV